MNRRYENQGPRTQADDDHRGNRQRVDRPYASEDDSFDSPRGSRYASAAAYDYGDQDLRRDYPGATRGSYYGSAQGNYEDYDDPRAQRGGWAGESQFGGGNYAGGSRQLDAPSNRNARFEQTRRDFNQAGGYGSGYSQVGNPGESLSSRGHFGRGPKGYTRSDDRIKEDISERLTDDYSLDASDITVDVRNGVVTLSGQVDERWMKHHAEDLVDRCSGVQDIENRLAINRSRGKTSTTSNAATPTSSTSASTRKQ